MKRAQRVIEVIGGAVVAIALTIWLIAAAMSNGASGVTAAIVVAVIVVLAGFFAWVDHRRRVRATPPR